MECENLDCNYAGERGWLISDPVCCPECLTRQIQCHCDICDKQRREIKDKKHNKQNHGNKNTL